MDIDDTYITRLRERLICGHDYRYGYGYGYEKGSYAVTVMVTVTVGYGHQIFPVQLTTSRTGNTIPG